MIKNVQYQSGPIIGVGAVVFNGDKILLVKRKKDPFKGQWSIPGGKQKIAETVYKAVKRELYEETGIKIKNVEFLDVVDLILKDCEGKVVFHFTILDFVAEWLSGECRPGGDSEEAKWFNVSRINLLKMPKKTKDIITKAMEKTNL